MNESPQLIGIFGTGRNGSTLLSRLLDGMADTYFHPGELTLPSAFNDLVRFGKVRSRTGAVGNPHTLEYLGREVATAKLIEYYDVQAQWIAEGNFGKLRDPLKLSGTPWMLMEQRDAWTVREFVPALLEAFAKWTGSQATGRLAFKSIETPYIAEYEALFPTMKFIHIIRDPIKTWASIKRTAMVLNRSTTWHHGGDSLRTLVHARWSTHARFIVEHAQARNHATVLYEDLVKDPAGEIARICAQLSLPLPPRLSTQTMFGREFERIGKYTSQPGVDTPVEVSAELGRGDTYQEVVTPRERSFIRLETWHLARRLGYFGNDQRERPPSVALAWLGADRWDVVNNHSARDWMVAVRCFVMRRIYIWRVCLGVMLGTDRLRSVR